jgi:hypothetical protein
MPLSREARVSILVGAVLALALIIIDPKQPFWRVFVLIAIGVCLFFIAKELDWVTRRNLQLSLVSRDTTSSEQSALRIAVAISVAALITIIFGGSTWPPVEKATETKASETAERKSNSKEAPPRGKDAPHASPPIDSAIPQRWIIAGNRFSEMPTRELCKEARGLAATIRRAIEDKDSKFRQERIDYQSYLESTPNASQSEKDQRQLEMNTHIHVAEANLTQDYLFKFRGDGILLLKAMALRAPAGTTESYLTPPYESDSGSDNPSLIEKLQEDLDRLAKLAEDATPRLAP